MRKKIGLKIFIPIIIAAIALPILVLGRDYGADYDELFGGENGFTIHTNESINTSVDSNGQLSTLVQRFVERYYTGNIYEGDNTYTYSASTNGCNYENMTCNISVNRYTIVNGMHSSGEVFKEYKDVKINIDNNVMDYFGTILNSNGDMIIKYDDSFFTDMTERDNYIRQYVSSKGFSNSDGNWVSFSYDAGLGLITYEVNGQNFKDNFTARVLVNSIQFDKTETEFSDNFKKLSTDGTLTIKTNGEITNYILDDYLMHQHIYTGGNSYSFDNDGEIVDNKVYIEMIQYGENGTREYSEKHLITLVKDTNVDKTKFALVNMRDEIVIPALAPTEDYKKTNYISNYFNTINYRQINLNNESNYNFDRVYSYNGEDSDNYIRFIEYSNDTGNAVDIQYNKIDIRFDDYSDAYSSEYTSKFGNGVTVRSDERTESVVANNIGYSYGVLSCNDDVSVCDIALSHTEEKRVEIHKVNITFDNSISDEFKRIFNLKEDGTIDIISDVSLNDESYIHFYTYDEVRDMSLEYVRDGNKFSLVMNPYSGGEYEKHTVGYNIVNNAPTAFYRNNVYLSKDFYPGENTRFWSDISNNYYFSKNTRTSNANTIGCDKNTGKCKVMLINNDKQLEVHEVTANVKNGKSPEFAKAFPSDSVRINAIYKDDEMYLYGASSAYFMSKTKDWVYLSDFTESTAKLTYNNLEVHSFDVEYAQGNAKHAAEIEKAKERLADVDLSSVRKDLEFVNKFYYGGEFILSSSNFNSKTLNDNFNKAVKNRHIGYYVVPEGGGGTYYENGAAGRLVLFYDGIAYDVLDKYVDFTNFNIIYIPTDTEKTPEAYVRAAQKRVDQYLGRNSGVVISYNGPIQDEEFFTDKTFERYEINKNSFDNNEYRISYKNSSSLMLIVADSSKMQKPDFAASDVTNNINVTSETVNYPSNTVVMSDVIDEKDSEYSKILEKAKIKNAHIVDINLYSSTVGDIDEFDGAEFNVSVPIEDEDLHDKDLVAYYIDDKGNVEEHPVVMDEFMANFETTHFSTYIIAEKVKSDKLEDAAQDVIKNPNTGDNILTYILLLILSGLVVGVTSYKFIKREN